MEKRIGIDIGGTKILAGIEQGGKVLESFRMPTECDKGVMQVVAHVQSIIKAFEQKATIKKIGIAIAGQVDRASGVLIYSPNMPKFHRVPLLKLIQKGIPRKGIRLKMENDANCFALGESRYGAAKGVKTMVGLTIGTGIGSGVVLNGSLYTGNGFASEIGHMVIRFGGERCSCGKRGCLEAYASGSAIESRYMRGLKRKKAYNAHLIASEIEKLVASKKDSLALSVYQEAGEALGIGFANMINIFDPEMIVVGGGLRNSRLLFQFAMPKKDELIFFKHNATRIVRARLGSHAGMIGATLLFS